MVAEAPFGVHKMTQVGLGAMPRCREEAVDVPTCNAYGAAAREFVAWTRQEQLENQLLRYQVEIKVARC